MDITRQQVETFSFDAGTLTVVEMQRATKKIGRVGFRFHDLRHIAGSRLLAEGASLPEVASILGHKTLSIARRYAHVTQTRLRDPISKVPASSTSTDKDESLARR
ncbi:MAG: tyrosine-type recombinase/integrase [Pseudomonadota bacterium]